MNRVLLSFVCAVFSLTASAQKVYFIYLQSEADQPFYAKVNNRVHSSSSSGYLILSRLHDSTYQITLGFPGNKWPEQNFSIAINKKDHGYLLKNFNEKGWGLFDLQTLAVQMPVAGAAKTGNSVSEENKDVSLFTDILSKAADDPSLREKPVIVVAEKKVIVPALDIAKKEETKVDPPASITTKKDPVVAAVAKDEMVVKTDPSTPLTTKEEPIGKPVAVVEEKKPVIVVEEKKSTVSPEIVKQEDLLKEPAKPVKEAMKVTEKAEETAVNKEEVKTVDVAPPAIKEESREEMETYQRSVVKRRSESSTTEGFGLVFIDETAAGEIDTIRLMIPNPKPVVVPQKSEPREEKKFLDIPGEGNNPLAAGSGVKEDKNTCSQVAGEADFFQVRKLMAAEEKDENMIAAAQKYFQAKCFTTQQVRNLGSLFLNDAARYKFFDMSYPYVSDRVNFTSLESELKDPGYLSQFKAIVKQ